MLLKVLIIAKTNFYSTKGVSSNEKAELKELMNWANEKIGLKLEKARREGSLRKLLQSSNTFLLVTRNNPQKTIKDEEITQHIESGVDTLCQIVGT